MWKHSFNVSISFVITEVNNSYLIHNELEPKDINKCYSMLLSCKKKNVFKEVTKLFSLNRNVILLSFVINLNIISLLWQIGSNEYLELYT